MTCLAVTHLSSPTLSVSMDNELIRGLLSADFFVFLFSVHIYKYVFPYRIARSFQTSYMVALLSIFTVKHKPCKLARQLIIKLVN